MSSELIEYSWQSRKQTGIANAMLNFWERTCHRVNCCVLCPVCANFAVDFSQFSYEKISKFQNFKFPRKQRKFRAFIGYICIIQLFIGWFSSHKIWLILRALGEPTDLPEDDSWEENGDYINTFLGVFTEMVMKYPVTFQPIKTTLHSHSQLPELTTYI